MLWSQFISNYIQVCALRRGILELMLGSLNNLSFRFLQITFSFRFQFENILEIVL